MESHKFFMESCAVWEYSWRCSRSLAAGPSHYLQDSFGHALTLLAGFPYLSVFATPFMLLFHAVSLYSHVVCHTTAMSFARLQISSDHPELPRASLEASQ